MKSKTMDVMEPAKIIDFMCKIRRMQMLIFVARSKLVPAIMATVMQLSYLKLNSYKPTSSE